MLHLAILQVKNVEGKHSVWVGMGSSKRAARKDAKSFANDPLEGYRFVRYISPADFDLADVSRHRAEDPALRATLAFVLGHERRRGSDLRCLLGDMLQKVFEAGFKSGQAVSSRS